MSNKETKIVVKNKTLQLQVETFIKTITHKPSLVLLEECLTEIKNYDAYSESLETIVKEQKKEIQQFKLTINKLQKLVKESEDCIQELQSDSHDLKKAEGIQSVINSLNVIINK